MEKTNKVVDRSQSIVKDQPQTKKTKQENLMESLGQITSYGILGNRKNRSTMDNARDVLEAMPHWAERYPQLTESLLGNDGAQYTKQAADASFVSMYATYDHLTESMDDISHTGSTAYKTLKLLNKGLKIQDLSNYISESTNTTTADINNPAYSVIDMVGIFYPGSVIHHLTDVMPLPQKWNKVFRIMPRFGNTGGGVTTGQIVFQNPTNGTYASLARALVIPIPATPTTFPPIVLTDGIAQPGTINISFTATSTSNPTGVTINLYDIPTLTNGTSTFPSPVTGTLGEGDTYGAIAAGSVVVYQQAVAGLPDQTTINASFVAAKGWTITSPIDVSWMYDYQDDNFNNTDIRTLGLTIETVDLQAKAHPLRITVSTELEFEMKSLANASAINSLQQTAVGLISNERDLSYINLLNLSAVQVGQGGNTLTFDAAPSQYYPVASKYRNFELILNEADALIRQTMGRGTLTTLVVGRIGRNVAMMCPTFKPAKSESNIGPVLFGTLRDGEVSLVYNPYQKDAIGSGTGLFTAYFKGYGSGDAPVLMGDWLPFYITPEMQMYDLNNYQAFASFYDQVVNPWVVGSSAIPDSQVNGGYVWRGQITGYNV